MGPCPCRSRCPDSFGCLLGAVGSECSGRRWCLVALCASVTAVAVSAPAASATPCPVVQSGTWIGSWSSLSPPGSGAAESQLVVAGNAVTGTMTFITGPTLVVVPNSAVTGTIACATLTGVGQRRRPERGHLVRRPAGERDLQVGSSTGVWEASLVTQSTSVSKSVFLDDRHRRHRRDAGEARPGSDRAGAPADLSIQESSTGGATLSGYFLVGRLVRIVAPPVTGLPGVAPYSFGFTVDASSLGGAVAADVAVFRNGLHVADCTSLPGDAPVPDPCVAGRADLPDGDAQIVVTSTMASVWGLGLPSVVGPPPGCGSPGLVAPSVSAGDATVLEGDAGLSVVSVPITLSTPSASTVSVSVATADGTARTPDDYVSIPPTTVTIAPGECSADVSVSVVGDGVSEKSEKFAVKLSAPVGATLADIAATRERARRRRSAVRVRVGCPADRRQQRDVDDGLHGLVVGAGPDRPVGLGRCRNGHRDGDGRRRLHGRADHVARLRRR